MRVATIRPALDNKMAIAIAIESEAELVHLWSLTSGEPVLAALHLVLHDVMRSRPKILPKEEPV